MTKKNPVLDFLGICCIFSVFLDKAVRGVLPFDFYYSYIFFALFLLLLLANNGRLALPPRWFTIGIAVIFTSSFFVLLVNNMMGFEFWKQVFGISFTALVYFNVIHYFNFNLRLIFRHYLKFAYWVALVGVIDNILHISGIHILHAVYSGPFQYREQSIMGEPFFLAVALTPAVAYYFILFGEAWRRKKKEIIIIVLCYLATYSSIAVAGLIISVLVSLYLNNFFNAKRGKILLVPGFIIALGLFISFLVENISLIGKRFNDTSMLFLSPELRTEEAGTTNSSTFALYSNYVIARDSFLKDPIFGSGLGSHPLIFTETFLRYFPNNYLIMFGTQNQQDANSKFLRLMSETGLIGLVLFLSIYFRFRVRKKNILPGNKDLTAMNYAIFVYILLCLIRNGNYINIGFFLFLFMYYYSWKYFRRPIRPARGYAPMLTA